MKRREGYCQVEATHSGQQRMVSITHDRISSAQHGPAEQTARDPSNCGRSRRPERPPVWFGRARRGPREQRGRLPCRHGDWTFVA